jgi:hypothetical protein
VTPSTRQVGGCVVLYGVYVAVVGGIAVRIQVRHALAASNWGPFIGPWPSLGAATMMVAGGLVLAAVGVQLIRRRLWARAALEALSWAGLALVSILGAFNLGSMLWGQRPLQFSLAPFVLLGHFITIVLLLVWLRSESVRAPIDDRADQMKISV